MKKLLNPIPSFFDLAVAGFLGIFLIQGNANRSLFFVFYTMFLLMLSFGMKAKREYNSKPLMLLALWSFLGLFIHSFVLSPRQVTYSWKVVYLTAEGFIYILFGIIFILTVVRYSTNPKFVYFFIPAGMIVLIPGMQRVGSSTMIVALGLSTIIYLFIAKRLLWGMIASVLGILAVIFNWSWLCFKFRSRPVAIYQLFINMFHNPTRYEGAEMVDPGVQLSPWVEGFFKSHASWLLKFKAYFSTLFGSGFDQYLNQDYKWVTLGDFKYGWVHKHNDYLNLANCLGPIVLIFLAWFIVESLRTIGIRPVIILFMAVALTSMSQLTLYDPAKAAVCLTITALTLTDGLRNKETLK